MGAGFPGFVPAGAPAGTPPAEAVDVPPASATRSRGSTASSIFISAGSGPEADRTTGGPARFRTLSSRSGSAAGADGLDGVAPHRAHGAVAGEVLSAPQEGHDGMGPMIPHRARVLWAAPMASVPQTSKRLEFLSKMAASGTEDPFVWYGLAMEYRSLGRLDEAFATFGALRERSPEYVPMYLMCGQMLESMGRAEDARAWLTSGVAAARAKGDGHALSELEAALGAL